jgi:hypothetical protein
MPTMIWRLTPWLSKFVQPAHSSKHLLIPAQRRLNFLV